MSFLLLQVRWLQFISFTVFWYFKSIAHTLKAIFLSVNSDIHQRNVQYPTDYSVTVNLRGLHSLREKENEILVFFWTSKTLKFDLLESQSSIISTVRCFQHQLWLDIFRVFFQFNFFLHNHQNKSMVEHFTTFFYLSRCKAVISSWNKF